MEIRLSNKLNYRKLLRLFLLILMIPMAIASVDITFETYFFVPKPLQWYVAGIYCLYFIVIDSKYVRERLNRDQANINTPRHYRLLKVTRLLFSARTQKEIFEQIVADWQGEYFEALNKKENDRLFGINIRNTYHFFTAMWQKSPFGDFIEFISKFRK